MGHFPCEECNLWCSAYLLLLYRYTHIFKSCILLVVLSLTQIFIRLLCYIEHLFHSIIFSSYYSKYIILCNGKITLHSLHHDKDKILTMKRIWIFMQNREKSNYFYSNFCLCSQDGSVGAHVIQNSVSTSIWDTENWGENNFLKM